MIPSVLKILVIYISETKDWKLIYPFLSLKHVGCPQRVAPGTIHRTMHEECPGPRVALFTEPCMKSADPSSINTGFLPLKRHLKHLGGKKGPEQQNNPTARS